jgi:hypothetical protein
LLQATNVLQRVYRKINLLYTSFGGAARTSDSEAQMKHVMPLIPKMEQI